MYVTNTHDIPKKSVPVMTIQAMACNPTTEQNDITTEDIQHYFVKAGLLDLDPETLQPKIKLYRDHDTGRLKGDASVCYARSESVDLALQVLDDSLWDVNHRIKVERAHFEAKEEHDGSHGDANNSGKDSTSTMNINDNDNKLAIANRKRFPSTTKSGTISTFAGTR
jgi:RNA recognition motif-containing protein